MFDIPSRKLFNALFILGFMVCALSHLATTFIIKEGDREVGRYIEDDGSDAVQVIQQEAPAKPKVESKMKTVEKKVASLPNRSSTPLREEHDHVIRVASDMPEKAQQKKVFWDLGMKIGILWIVSTIGMIWVRKKFKD